MPHSAREFTPRTREQTPVRRMIPRRLARWIVPSVLGFVGMLFLALWLSGAASSSDSPTPVRAVSAVAPYYDSGSFWNTPISAGVAVDRNSSAIIAYAIAPYGSGAVLSNDNAWGMGYAYADDNSKTYTVACTKYCSSDSFVFPIPKGAKPSTGSDHHLAVIHGNQELDLWEASYDAATDRWSAGGGAVTEITGWGANCPPGHHCVSAVAAGFAMLGGSIRPEEIAQGHIDHALALLTPATRSGYIACPATNTDGASSNPNAIPEGARIQLDPAFDVAQQPWPAWEKTIARALQTYGAYVADTGGAMGLYAVTDMNQGNASWSSVGMTKSPSLFNLPWSSFRVLEIHSCN